MGRVSHYNRTFSSSFCKVPAPDVGGMLCPLRSSLARGRCPEYTQDRELLCRSESITDVGSCPAERAEHRVSSPQKVSNTMSSDRPSLGKLFELHSEFVLRKQPFTEALSPVQARTSPRLFRKTALSVKSLLREGR